MEILLAVAAVITIAAVVFAMRWWTWRPMIKRRVLVQLNSGDALQGVVLSRRGSLLVLADVTVLSIDQGRSASSSADGTVIVDRAQVRWIQVA